MDSRKVREYYPPAPPTSPPSQPVPTAEPPHSNIHIHANTPLKSVTTRNQLAQSHTNSKRRRGGGRRRPNAEGRLQTPLAEVAMLAEVDQLGKD